MCTLVNIILGKLWSKQCFYTPVFSFCCRFFVVIECFYRCSSTAHWEGSFSSSLNHLPICSDCCDRWYQVCAADMTCPANWITDWNYTDNGSNHCMAEAKYSRFDQVHILRILHFPGWLLYTMTVYKYCHYATCDLNFDNSWSWLNSTYFLSFT